MKTLFLSIFSIALVNSIFSTAALAHPVAADAGDDHAVQAAAAQYIANAGVIVTSGETKILFDPLFRVGFNNYLVPTDETFAAMMAGEAPYDGVDVVFISHAHGDHFSSEDANAFLAAHPEVRLVAPAQAIHAMKSVDAWDDAYQSRITSIVLERGDPAFELNWPGIDVFAVRIPHAGWPSRAEVQNLVYRVSLDEDATVMHMGDADVNDDHYAPYAADWSAKKTNTAFPPYWFFLVPGGVEILKDRLNVEHAIGVHVPVNVPDDLKATGEDFFSQPGDIRQIGEPKKD